ncbi:MAG: fibronectin type III domain-containing protein, partial [Bacteroidota bacterium]
MKSTLILIAIAASFFQGAINAQCFTADATIWQNTWASCTPSSNPKSAYGTSHWIQYDLGQERRLSKSWVWNTNDPQELDRGFKDVHIDYSLDGQNWTYWGSMTFPQGTGTAVYGGFPGPDLVGIQARYILITAIDNYGDGACYGLAEVKFNLLPYPPGSSPDGTYENCRPVTNPDAFVEGPSQVTLTWEPIEEIENYLVEYRLLGTEEWIIALDNYSEAYLEDLIPLETYEYRITSLCFSEMSEPVTGTFTLSEDALCPQGEDVAIFLEELGGTEAFFYWPFDDIIPDGMTVTFYQEGSPPDQWMVFNVTEPEIFLDNLLPATDYVLFVSWTCAGQTIQSDEYDFTTLDEDAGFCNS